MAEPYIGEIRMFAFNFAPTGWALCNGQLLPISQNDALFSLLGTFYGGNGTTTFALPNLQSRVAIHMGQGSGLSSYSIGQTGGAETVTLLSSQMPVHSHSVHANTGAARSAHPAGHVLGEATTHIYADRPQASAVMNAGMIGDSGEGQPHNNIQPYLVLNFCIALSGIFPPRS